MATRFVSVDHDTPLLLPPNLRDWVPGDHLVHFILDAVAALNLSQVKVNQRGTGSEQYPPLMMVGLLMYSYATGNFSSRRIEQSTYDSVPVRVLTADTHPDHDTLCTFRRENQALLTEGFVKILQLAQQLKVLQVGQITVAVDGTKLLANASKHSAVSYERAGRMIKQLELEVKQLLLKAEQADSTPLQEGLTIPREIVRRQERKAALEKARAEIEARAHARYTAELAEYKKKVVRHAANGGRGRPPKAPTDKPDGTDQYNFTEPGGGVLFIGVNDDQTVRGIKEDLEIFNGSADKFLLLVQDLIASRIGAEFAPLIKTRCESIDGKTVCVVEVENATEPAFLKDDGESRFYVREGNRTNELDARESHAFIKTKRWNG